MDKEEMFIICKCPKCGKKLRIKPNAVSVFCLKCRIWSRVAPGKRDNDSESVKK